jgi:hypothetical protein
MEIILSKQCESLTGSLGQGFGYHVQKRTDRDGKIRFWGVRKSKGDTPRDGHLRFILSCAELAQSKLHITDIRVPSDELMNALWKAGRETLGDYIFTEPDKFPETFHADDIMKFKNEYSL